MITKINRKEARQRRHRRVRAKISGTAECPRLAVAKTKQVASMLKKAGATE